MRSGPTALALAAVLTRCVLPAAADARQVAPTADDALPVIGPFASGTMGIEFGAAGLGELRHVNGSREWLAGGSAGLWWAFGDGRTLIVQFHATEVFQREPRHAFVNGIVPSLRWRLVQGSRIDLFAEVGLGVTWSDTSVPRRGTRFNYLAETGVGVMRRIGRQTQAVLGARLLHLSNKNREGRSRNPDIEALGGYAALAVGF